MGGPPGRAARSGAALATVGVMETRTERVLDRWHGVTRLGRDGQVDEKAIVIPPGSFAESDPFLLLSEDWFSSPGFEWHPHRGIETVTVVLGGALEHGDNHGNAGVLEPGAVQWMTAGEGIIHRELAYRDEHAHTLQLWVNLPAARKMTPARYQDLAAASHAEVAAAGTSLRVVSGRVGEAVGPAENHWPITTLQVRVEPGRSLTVPLPGVDRAFCYVLAGRCALGRREALLDAGSVGWSEPVGPVPSSLEIAVPEGEAVCEILLCSGAPIGEQVVAYGPFVMSTGAEIEEAFRDYRQGRFGAIPALARVVGAPAAGGAPLGGRPPQG